MLPTSLEFIHASGHHVSRTVHVLDRSGHPQDCAGPVRSEKNRAGSYTTSTASTTHSLQDMAQAHLHAIVDHALESLIESLMADLHRYSNWFRSPWVLVDALWLQDSNTEFLQVYSTCKCSASK